MDHDRLFKELLTVLFPDFIDLFYPAVAAYLDRDSIEFLDKEVFTDVSSGARHEVDLVVKARFRGRDTHFLVHVETQASAQEEFPKRMFHYFARLHEKHDLPVYPIALFSYDRPLRAEPSNYDVTFPDTKVLNFNYRVIQLNRLNWREYARRPNPVAAALMAKMDIRPEDRWRVKLECIRLLATLRLNPAKMQLIRGFVDSYLELSEREQKALEEDIQMLEPAEKESLMEVTNVWEERGKVKGLEMAVLRLLSKRFGAVEEPVRERIHSLSPDRLEELTEALLDFRTLADAEEWLGGKA